MSPEYNQESQKDGQTDTIRYRDCRERRIDAQIERYFDRGVETERQTGGGWVAVRMCGETDGRTDGHKTDGWTDRQTDGQRARETDGQRDRQTNGRTDRHTDGRTDRLAISDRLD